MALNFEGGTSAVVGEDDLWFDAMDGERRIRFILSEEAMMDLASTHDEMSRQKKFELYNLHRDQIHQVASDMYAANGAGKNDLIVIRAADLR